jgi:hypothetical protein
MQPFFSNDALALYPIKSKSEEVKAVHEALPTLLCLSLALLRLICQLNNWDMVLQKTVGISERVGLEFRMEAYNLFNRVQFCQPDNLTSDTASFGQSTCEVRRADQTSGARQIQFGLKLRF